MKKVVLSALLALGLCFGLAAAPEAGAPAGKSGKAAQGHRKSRNSAQGAYCRRS